MKTVAVPEARDQLGRPIREALAGEKIVISVGEDLVQLVPVADANARRRFGTAAGMISIADDFADPIPGFEHLS